MITDIVQYASETGQLAFITVKEHSSSLITIASRHWINPITVQKSWMNSINHDDFVPFRLQFIY